MKKSTFNFFLPLIVIVLFTVSVAAKTTELEKTMFRFERAYIPVYLHSLAGDMSNAKSALLYLDYEWNLLYDKFGYPKDLKLNQSFREVNDLMDDLCGYVDANQEGRAVITLHRIKQELREIRTVCGINYFFDWLYLFEYDWNRVTEITGDPMMCLYEWNEFEAYVVEAKRKWHIAETVQIPFEYLQMTEGQVMQVYIKREILSKKLRNYKLVLSCGDQGGANTAAKEIRKAYLDFLQTFGRFTSRISFVALLMDLPH